MRVLSVRSKRIFFILKAIVYGFKIIGLAPFAVPIKISTQINPVNTRIEAFQSSKIGLAYNMLLLIIVQVIAIKFYWPTIFSAYNSSESSSIDAQVLVLTAEGIIFILASCVVIISWGWKQKEAASVMNRLLEIDVRLSFLKKQPFDKRVLMSSMVHVILNVSLWVVFWIRIIAYSNFDIFLLTLFSKLPDYVIYWFIIEYFIMAGLLARYIESVNKYLTNFNEFGFYLSRPRDSRNLQQPSPRLFAPQVQVNSLPINDQNAQLSSLKLLHNVRTTLFELCEDVADFFSLPILFCISCCFLPLVRELYIVTTFTKSDDVSSAETASYVFLIILLYVYPVMSLAANVTRTVKEAKLTGHIVHKLLATQIIGNEIKTELTQFSLQLLHEDVQFSAYGFFTLDSSLLLSMLGGAATYFVALMQFQSGSSCSCSKPSNTTLG